MIGLRKLMTGSTEATSAALPRAKRFRLGSGIVADPIRHIIIRDGHAIAVEPRIMQLLTYLAARPRQIISKEELRERVWGTHVVDEAVHRAVSLLRSALGDTPRQAAVIETVPRHGYRLLIAPAPVDAMSTRPLNSRGLGLAAAAAGLAALALLVSPAFVSSPAEAPALPVVAPETSATASAETPHASTAQRQLGPPMVAPTSPRTRAGALSKTPAAALRAPAAASEPSAPPAVAPAAPPARDMQRGEAPAPHSEAPVAQQATQLPPSSWRAAAQPRG